MSRTDGINLLRIAPVRRVLQSRYYPYVFQFVSLGVFLALTWLAWGRFAPAGVNQKLYAKTHLATLIIWGMWWPMMIWTAVLFGRIWCSVCPMELVSNISERIGRALGIRQLTLKKWMISGSITVALYALIQLLVAGAKIHRVPAYTSWFLIALLAAAAITGLAMKDRAFCRAFCPVGQLLATYGRGGMLAVRKDNGQACKACTGQECLVTINRSRLDARSCPSLLNPTTVESNRDCLVCGQCMKSCSQENMGLWLRRPFSLSDLREAFASWPTTLFVMLASGFVTWELSGEWAPAEELFLAPANWIANWIGIPALHGYIEGAWALLVFPPLVWTLIALVRKLLGVRSTISETWRSIALPVAVIVSAGHMTKAMAKLVTWAGFLPYAIQDPSGLSTIGNLQSGALAKPAPLLAPAAIATIGVGLVSLAIYYSWTRYRPANATAPLPRLLPKAVFALAFLAIIAGYGWGAH